MRALLKDLLFLSVVILIASSVSNCPQENVYQNKCYQFTGVVLDWESAEEYCQLVESNGHLAASDSGFVNNFLFRKFRC